MEANLQEWLLKILVAFPFGVGMVVFFILCFKRLQHFYFIEYQRNSKEKFKENILANIYLYLAVACMFPAIFVLQSIQFKWGLIGFGLCVDVFLVPIIPIGVLGIYWKSYQTKKLFGGFIPLVQEQSAHGQSVPTKQQRVDPLKIKIPRRTVFMAALVAFFVFMGLFLFSSWVGWGGSAWNGMIFRLSLSALMGFGIFITINMVARSRRLERLRNGETLEDDDNI